MINSLRRGVITLSMDIVNSPAPLLIFSKAVPVRTDIIPFRNSIEYYCFSEHFDELTEGEIAPNYDVILNQRLNDKEEVEYEVTFKRL